MPLMNPLLLPGPLLLAQDELLDLAGRGLGQLAELDGGGGLEAGDVLLAEVYYLLLCRVLSLLEDHESLRALAPLLVRDGHHGGLHHRRVAGDRLFDLDGGDVLAAGDDDVLAPIADLDVAVGVPDRHVARVIPAAFERLLGSLLVLEVALGDHVAVHQDLAQGLAVALDVVHVLVHDPDQVGGDVALTLTRHEPRPLLELQVLPLGMDAARGYRAIGLRQAVDVQGTDVEAEQPLDQGGGGRGAGYGRRYLRVQLVGAVVVDDPDLDGRGGAVVGDPLRLEELPDPGRLHLPQANVRGRDGRDGPREGPPVAVEHREGPQVLRLVVHPDLYDVPEGAQVRPAVGVRDDLRTHRGAGGVVYGDGLFLVLEHALDRLWRAVCQVVLVGIPLLARVVDAHDLDALDVLEQILQLGVHEGHLRPRVLDDVGDLALAEARVYGDEHEPRRRHAEASLQHRRGVRAEKGYPVALLETRVAQPRGEAVHPLFQLPVRVAPLAVDHGRLVREHVRAAPEEIDGGKLAAVDLLAHRGRSSPSPV